MANDPVYIIAPSLINVRQIAAHANDKRFFDALLPPGLRPRRAAREPGPASPEESQGHLPQHPSRLSSIRRQSREGESGRSRGSTPRECNAAATAFAIRPPTGIVPPSPAPFAPSGLCGDGCSCSMIARMLGKSVADGIR